MVGPGLVSLFSRSPDRDPVVAGGGICEGRSQNGVLARVLAEDTPTCECTTQDPQDEGVGGRGLMLGKGRDTQAESVPVIGVGPPGQVLIFAEKKADVDAIHEYLLLKGVEAVAIHGGKG